MMGSWPDAAALLAPLTGALLLGSIMVAEANWLLRRIGFVEEIDSVIVEEPWIDDMFSNDQDTVGLYAPGNCIHTVERGS